MEILSANTSQKSIPVQQKYKKMQIIGNGTFGSVYLAKNTLNKEPKQVAVKYVHQNKKYKNRQIEILKLLKHSNIVEMYEFYYEQKNQKVYLNLIMEYVPHTLSSRIKDNIYCKTFISNEQIVKYSYGLIKALIYLNVSFYDQNNQKSINVAHRDIKPSNILLNDEGQAKLCDFGSAKVLVSGQKNISYICSRYYRSPELVLGAVQYTTAVDIWSLGCCIAQMITNRVFFDGENNKTILLKIIRTIGTPTLQDMQGMKIEPTQIQVFQPIGIKTRLLKSNSSVSEELVQLIQKMLVFDPTKRITAENALKLPVFSKQRENQSYMQKQ